ncbi:MAG: hypothetical protein ACREQ5_00945 [Candidatus Dormibacteria bacterium]
MATATPDPVTKFSPVTLTGVIPAAPDATPDNPDGNSTPQAHEDVELALDAATRALIVAMRHHGLGEQRGPAELTDRARLIIDAACETTRSRCVVLVKGSEADAHRLAVAGVREVLGAGVEVQPVDIDQATRLINRMVTDRG